MRIQYPDDADGDALRKVEAAGADMSQPMVIEFSIEAPDPESARRIAERVSEHGFDPTIHESDDDDSVSVYCARTMLATYEGVVAEQARLTELSAAFGGTCDGWGTFGNTQTE
jgi:regulator of RNase E activity RraB